MSLVYYFKAHFTAKWWYMSLNLFGA